MTVYEINKYHGEYNVRPRSASDVKYIVVHYTGSGTSAVGAARANCIYFSGGDRQASAHYFIDDGSIYEYADPATKLTWHVGDGKGEFGITNTNAIGIEVCMNGDSPFTESEISRLQWLVCRLMRQFGVPASRVVRHYDASRKLCPYYYTPGGSGGDAAWKKLHARITSDTVSDGWQKLGGVWYYYTNGAPVKSRWRKIGGVWYSFDGSGKMRESTWFKDGGKWYYLRASGAMATGWQKVDGVWYYLKDSGAMAASECLKIGGKWYAFRQSGAMCEKTVALNAGGSLKI